MAVNRRTFLGLGAAGTAFVALGGLGLGLRGTAMRTPASPLQVLTERQFSVLAAIADVVCPGGDGLPSASDLQVAERVDAVLATLHPGVGAELGAVLLVFDNAVPAVLLDGRFTPFSRLPASRRVAALDRWRLSRLETRRLIYRSVTGLVMASYWADPSTWPHVGYAGPPVHMLVARDALSQRKAHAGTEEATDGG